MSVRSKISCTLPRGYSMKILIEDLERLERSHELVTALSMEVFPGSLQIKQLIEAWRETLGNDMNLKHSEGYHETVVSKYLVGSSSAPYCNSKYLTDMVVVDAKTQHRLIDQMFPCPNACDYKNL